MLRVRVIPCLLLKHGTLVKTRRFKTPRYVGDPVNTVRIFNELEVDELAFLDIHATREGRPPNYEVLREIANECFMPLSYGGGVTGEEAAETLFAIGFEKIVVNSAAFSDPDLITRLSRRFGAQAVIASIDVRKSILGRYRVMAESGSRRTRWTPVAWAREMEDRGAGEILLTSIDREGTWLGFDIGLTTQVADAVGIPVIASGGAATLDDIAQIVHHGHASAVALGNMVVFHKPGMGVLVNFPDHDELARVLERPKP